ncbi:type VI secretion system contractile sheath small subunit [Pseudoalteromonas sp. ACER1]|jgi:type VI secretion system protein ImpB|uniref:Type VI secretion system contractile sheath small subunit n=2 Tax=Pseudoalteromonas TaxID=53246 RepID=A0A3A3EIZ3_9GAMM|nr:MULTISPECIES: type VI secretion system contractile sheath small subunit [Pseudoalteromonas]MBC7007157.1 type VI secretion system contractile sheath small subunit [Pseudoalteromonas sp. BZK2]MCF2848420.1 type VI secretion system contractile sheath small subunit [Pseudoalteromonas sp. PAST1]MCO7211906.1 type VI secretion system contractile sheath small subunit [Pseudoalteromonas sp. ACER1]RJF35662.1 type VI secretion system contractile sheath small subunit [Pseudoalteromonas profundi]TMP16310|tara:strand:+ start:13858 stop:14361 length:504 start_codon:yes stop_codon:yes gene_type:complete
MSIHDKLKRVRKPRVHITYDVETEGAIVKKELPFVVGVMGDFSGHNQEVLKPLKDRRFIQIDRENFNDVLKKMSPSLKLDVDNTLTDDGTKFSVDLNFKSIDDFEPAAVVNQVEPLRNLMETRNKLRDLMTKIDRSEELENVLEEVLSNTASLDSIAKELKLEESEK